MNIVIVHYHLNRGGVARVIANQAAAIDSVVDSAEKLRLVVLHGGRTDAWTRDELTRSCNVRSSVEILPALDYDSGSGTSGRLVSELPARLRELNLPPDDTVVHFHNHSLGTNLGLAEAIWSLAEAGYGLLLQIHDFVEDYRPSTYRYVVGAIGGAPWRRLYPVGSRIHYGALNATDACILESAGVPSDHLHTIPNPVFPFDDVPSQDDARARLESLFRVNRDVAFLLYPVRCIRRKNLGEALLLSVLAPRKTVVGFTLAPLNPAERAFYSYWRNGAEARRLPCRFEIGSPEAMTFSEVMAAADLTVTTSIADGFGMAFVEGWQLGLPLAGRDLPEITQPFVREGLVFDNLYSALNVPLRWIDVSLLKQKYERGFRKVLRAYGMEPSAESLDALSAKWSGDSVDFGDMDEQLQLRLIDVLRHDAARRDDIYAMNRPVEQSLTVQRGIAEATIRENARIASQLFGKEALGRRLLSLYRAIAGGPRAPVVESLPYGERILDGFLTPDRYRLLRA